MLYRETRAGAGFSVVQPSEIGGYLKDEALDRVHNAAVGASVGLVEFHNHRLGPPAFSPTDEGGLTPMAEYVTNVLVDRPYGAAVYAAGRIHAEYWSRTPEGMQRGPFRAILVLGEALRNVKALTVPDAERLQRQALILSQWGSETLTHLRIGIVGAGGTGSQVALALAYLGAADLLVVCNRIG